jgi:hypothetical protein
MAEDEHYEKLTERLHALELDHVEIKGDVRGRVERIEQRIGQFAAAHENQTGKLDTIIEMGKKRDVEMAQIKTAISSIAPHVAVIKDAMVIWRFMRFPVVALATGLTTAAFGFFSPPAWLKNLFK